MTEPTSEPTTEERIADAAEKTARNTEILVLIAQWWSAIAALGLIIGVAAWVHYG